MNGIEKTLRDTLTKLENPDAETRQKLYGTIESILRKSLEPFIESRPEIANERLQGLKDIISVIEREYSTELPADISSQDEAPSVSVASVVPAVAPAAKLAEVRDIDPVTTVQPEANSVSPEIKLDPTVSQSAVHWPDANLGQSIGEQSAPDISIEKRRGAENEQSLNPVVNAPDIQEELKIHPASNPTQITDKKTERRLQRKEKREKRRRRGGFLELIAGSIVSVVFIIFLFGGIWLFSNSEYYQLFLDWRNGGETISQEGYVADKDFIPKPLTGEAEQVGNWVEIFGYQDVENVRGRGEVLVETIEDGGDGGIRITSVNSSEFGEAQIFLDANSLQPLTSRRFAIALSMFVERPTQIYIKCILKNGVETDRRRFQLDGGINNVILEMNMAGVTSFEQAPYISVNSDITGAGHSVDLYDIRYQIIE